MEGSTYRHFKDHTSDFKCEAIFTRGCVICADPFQIITEDWSRCGNDNELLHFLKQSFLYLLDKLPKTEIYDGMSKKHLVQGLDSAKLSEVIFRIAKVANNIRKLFRLPHWHKRVLFPTSNAMHRYIDFLVAVEDSIDWDAVDAFRVSQYMKLQKLKKNRMPNVSNDVVKAQNKVIDAQAELIKALKEGSNDFFCLFNARPCLFCSLMPRATQLPRRPGLPLLWRRAERSSSTGLQ